MNDRQEKAKIAREEKVEQMNQLVKDIAEQWDRSPELMADALQFGSQFYKYSVNNMKLIYAQNPHAVYVGSFQSWKEKSASVKKGEHGMNIFVPVQVTYLKIDKVNGETEKIQLRYASKEQKEAYKAGKIEGVSQTVFKLGTVFDIAQTTYPKEKYPELFNMGYSSRESAEIVEGLKKYCVEKLGCPVTEVDLSSISLRGSYYPGEHKIELNEMMEDTQKMSTLSHEMGHALIHHDPESRKNKSTSRKEFEADAVSVMISSHFGEEIRDTRKEHLAAHYKQLKEQQPDVDIDSCIADVFRIYKENIEEMDQYVETEIQRGQEMNLLSEQEKEWGMHSLDHSVDDYFDMKAAQFGLDSCKADQVPMRAEIDMER